MCSSDLTSAGVQTWTKWIDKSNSDYGIATDYDTDSNVYLLSKTYDEQDAGQGNWYYRPNVTKLNDMGELQWMKTYSWDGTEGSTPVNILVDSEDKVVIGQHRWRVGNYRYEPIVHRLLPNGNILWAKKWALDGSEGYGHGLPLDNEDRKSTRLNSSH